MARQPSLVYQRLKAYDDQLREQYGEIVVGCDEVGRGAVAGPMCSAAVILPVGVELQGLNDSKKLEEKKREELYEVIMRSALAVSVAWSSVEEIDSKGITYANQHTMEQACAEVQGMMPCRVSVYVVDQAPRFPFSPCIMIPKADGTSQAVAAASIVAKVTRDRFMTALAEEHPGYGLATNKGYLNNGHMEGLLKNGRVVNLHRISFHIKGIDK